MVIPEPAGIRKAALSTLRSDSRRPEVKYEARGVEWTTIGVDGDGRGSQRRGREGDSSNDVLIYAGSVLEGGVKEAGSDKSRSDVLDIQAPGIPRRLLPSSEAMIQATCSSPIRAKRTMWWW